MTTFYDLNAQQYVFEPNIPKDTKVCICCTSQSGVSFNMNTCTHSSFLTTILKIKLEYKDAFICVLCHSMLKKIEIFKQQVEDSVALLLDQAPILKVNKLHNLQCSQVEIDNLKIEAESGSEVKSESGLHECKFIETDVKVEVDYSDGEPEPEMECVGEPLVTLKRQKRTKKEGMIEGKIKMIVLTKKELSEEREELARKERYINLPYKCIDCIIGYDHELTLKSHLENRHPIGLKGKKHFVCEVCKSILKNKMSYNEHLKRHYRRLECMVCNRRYNHLQSAVQHYDEQHAAPGDHIQQGYTCKLCGFATASNRVYRYHLDKHKKKPKCKICGNSFVNSNGLKVHMYTVHKQSSRIYKCDLCDVSYRAKSGLVSHMRSAHRTDPGSKAFCVPCGTHFRSEQGLLNHIKTHSKHIDEKDKRFICDECGAKFVKKCNLQLHINWEHLKIDTHKCAKCDKIFKSQSALNRHVNYVHHKKRPPRNKICDYCGRGFTTQAILQSHIRTHTGERPLQCGACPATFAHSAALYTHNKLLHKWRE